MGKKSIKENKNIYQQLRENLELTRVEAADLMQYISEDRIEKIESEKTIAHPDEVLIMAEAYKDSSLHNYYCSHECPIGAKYISYIPNKDLSQITVELLAAINQIEKMKDQLVEIVVDGKIDDNEKEDFDKISSCLMDISTGAKALQIWMEQQKLNSKK